MLSILFFIVLGLPSTSFGAGSSADSDSEKQEVADELRSEADPTILKRRAWLDTEWNSFTDGSDNWSRLTPAEASAAASEIDVPVYIIGIVPLIDNPSSDLSATTPQTEAVASSLSNLTLLTGGRSYSATTSLDRSVIAQQILDELRHQYLIAFEAGSKPGWHSLVVRTRDKDLVVRARSGYNAGQSRPIS